MRPKRRASLGILVVSITQHILLVNPRIPEDVCKDAESSRVFSKGEVGTVPQKALKNRKFATKEPERRWQGTKTRPDAAGTEGVIKGQSQISGSWSLEGTSQKGHPVFQRRSRPFSLLIVVCINRVLRKFHPRTK